jgi:hypothetical protein
MFLPSPRKWFPGTFFLKGVYRPMSKFTFVRSIGCAVLLSSLAAPLTMCAEPAAATDAYTQAVNDYINAATKETAVVRTELEKNEKIGRKEAWADVRAALERCQRLIDELKSSTQASFDSTKARYEKARADLNEKVAAAKQQ